MYVCANLIVIMICLSKQCRKEIKLLDRRYERGELCRKKRGLSDEARNAIKQKINQLKERERERDAERRRSQRQRDRGG